MFLLLTLLFPGVLLGLMLAMERVEEPLRDRTFGDELTTIFESAHPEEVETFVSQGMARALHRYWGRRKIRAKLFDRRLARG